MNLRFKLEQIDGFPFIRFFCKEILPFSNHRYFQRMEKSLELPITAGAIDYSCSTESVDAFECPTRADQMKNLNIISLIRSCFIAFGQLFKSYFSS